MLLKSVWKHEVLSRLFGAPGFSRAGRCIRAARRSRPHVAELRTESLEARTLLAGTGGFFDSQVALAAASATEAGSDVALGDFNHDGVLDPFVVGPNASQRYYFFETTRIGTGHSSITGVDRRQVGNDKSAFAVDVGDFDGNGEDDAVVVHVVQNGSLISGKLEAHYNETGELLFSRTDEFLFPDAPIDVALGDLNGDARPDIWVTTVNESRIYLRDSVSFGATPQVLAGAGSKLKLADLDGDGDLDAFTVRGPAGAQVLLNQGGLSFAVSNVSDTTGAESAAFGDFDADGDLDVVVGIDHVIGSTRQPNVVLLNNGSGVFSRVSASNVPPTSGENPVVTTADVDGDGKLNMVFGYGSGGRDVWGINPLTPGFEISFFSIVQSPASTGESITGLAVSDFDGDGNPDLFTTSPTEFTRDANDNFESFFPNYPTRPILTPQTDRVWVNPTRITTPIGQLDFGDANGTQTQLIDNGARHTIHPLMRLGAEIDAEIDAVLSANQAQGDDVNDITDDEDGIHFPINVLPLLSAGTTGTFAVDVAVATGGETPVLQGWIDLNRDGVFSEASERIFTNQAVTDGTNHLTFSVPGGSIATAGSVPLRFRLSTQRDLGPTGAAPDGEVEDTVLLFANDPPLLVDLGRFEDGGLTISGHGSGETSTMRLSRGSRLLYEIPSAAMRRIQIANEPDQLHGVSVDFSSNATFPREGIFITGIEDELDLLFVNGGGGHIIVTNEDGDPQGGTIQQGLSPDRRITFNGFHDGSIFVSNASRLSMTLVGDLGQVDLKNGAAAANVTLSSPNITDVEFDKAIPLVEIYVTGSGTQLQFREALFGWTTRTLQVDLPLARLAIHTDFMNALRTQNVDVTIFNQTVDQIDIGTKQVFFDKIDVSGDEPIWLKIDVSGDEPIWAERLLINREVFRATKLGNSRLQLKTGAELPISLPLGGEYRMSSSLASRDLVLSDGRLVLRDLMLPDDRPELNLRGTDQAEKIFIDLGSGEGFRQPVRFNGGGGDNSIVLIDKEDLSPSITRTQRTRDGANVSGSFLETSFELEFDNVQFVADYLHPVVRSITLTASSEAVILSRFPVSEADVDLTVARDLAFMEVVSGARQIDFVFDEPNSSVNEFRLDLGAGHDHLVIDHLGKIESVGGTLQNVSSFGARQISIVGGSGNDTIEASSGEHALIVDGGHGADSIEGSRFGDLLFGQAGNDTVSGGASGDVMTGGDGFDLLFGDDGSDSIEGGNHGDTLSGGTGIDTLSGNDGPDVLDGDDDNDVLFGGNDADQLNGGNGNDTLRGESGDDWLLGSMGEDSLDGGDDDDTLLGGGNSDTLIVSAGYDVVNGQGGTDVLRAISSRDLHIKSGELRSTILEFVNLSTINELNPFLADVTVFRGVDVIELTLSSGQQSEGRIVDAKEVTVPLRIGGSNGPDTLVGGRGQDRIDGRTGNDVIFGQEGDDQLNGSEGADTIHGGDGDDQIFGGSENDVLDGGNGNDGITGDSGADAINGSGGNDTLNGGTENDTLLGGLGNDALAGAEGNDVLLGEGGNDYVNGQAATDRVTAGGNGSAVTSMDRVVASSFEIDNALSFDFGRLLNGLL